MFHIKNDKRSKASAKLVVEAFDSCLKTTNYPDLTITQLCKVSTISRATFYRLFDDIDDVLYYKCYHLSEEMMETFSHLALQEIMRRFFQFWMSEKWLLKVILDNHHEDILYKLHEKQAEKIATKLFHLENQDVMTTYQTSLLTGIMIATLVAWEKTGSQDSVETVITQLEKNLENLYLSLKF